MDAREGVLVGAGRTEAGAEVALVEGVDTGAGAGELSLRLRPASGDSGASLEAEEEEDNVDFEGVATMDVLTDLLNEVFRAAMAEELLAVIGELVREEEVWGRGE